MTAQPGFFRRFLTFLSALREIARETQALRREAARRYPFIVES